MNLLDGGGREGERARKTEGCVSSTRRQRRRGEYRRNKRVIMLDETMPGFVAGELFVRCTTYILCYFIQSASGFARERTWNIHGGRVGGTMRGKNGRQPKTDKAIEIRTEMSPEQGWIVLHWKITLLGFAKRIQAFFFFLRARCSFARFLSLPHSTRRFGEMVIQSRD